MYLVVFLDFILIIFLVKQYIHLHQTVFCCDIWWSGQHPGALLRLDLV